MLAWHGTLSLNGYFTTFEERAGFVSFATERDHARWYAKGGVDSAWKEGSRLFEVDLDVRKPLDYLIPEHRDLVIEFLDRIDFDHFPRDEWAYWVGERGAYQCLEDSRLLHEYGFDAVYTCEWGWRNIHVLDVRKIKVLRIFDEDPGSLGFDRGSGGRVECACEEKRL